MYFFSFLVYRRQLLQINNMTIEQSIKNIIDCLYDSDFAAENVDLGNRRHWKIKLQSWEKIAIEIC